MLRNLGVWIVESLNKRVNYTKAYQYEKKSNYYCCIFFKEVKLYFDFAFLLAIFKKKRNFLQELGSENTSLTSRQMEILEYIAKGCTNVEIARFLGLSDNTVKVHVARLFSALNVSNRTEAALCFQKSKEFQIQDGMINSIVIIVSDFKSNTLPLDTLKRMKDTVVSLLSLKTFVDVVLEYNLDQVESNSRDFILLRTEVEKTGASFDLNIYIDDYKNKASIWSQSLSNSFFSGKHVEDWGAQAISATMFRALITHINLTESEKLSFQDNKSSSILFGLRMIEIRSQESVQKAQLIFSGLLKQNPHNIFALYGLAATEYLSLMHRFTKDAEQAKGSFFQCCQTLKNLSQSNAQSWYIQAVGQMMIGDIPGAILLLKNAIRIDPSLQMVYTLLGQLYCFTGEYQKGYDYMDYGFSLCPEFRYSGNNLVIMSILLFGLERYPEAAAVLEESFYLQTNSWINRGFYLASLFHMGQVNKAKKEVKDLQKMIDEANPFTIRNSLNLLNASMRKRVEDSLSGLQITIP